MIIKMKTAAERAEINHLSEYAFNSKLTPERFQHYLELWEHTENWGVLIDEQLASQIIVLPYKVNLFGESVKMAGIGNVATYPEYRGSGGISKLFAAIFEELNENDTVLSYLAPFSQPFYRKYGYEVIFNDIESVVDKEDIGTLPFEKKGSVKRVDHHQAKWQTVIKQLYKDTLEKKDGSLIRDNWWWHSQFKTTEGLEVAICFDETGTPVGYLFYKMQPQEFIISEIATKNAFAVRKLSGFIVSHDGTFETFKLVSSDTDQINLLFPESRVIKQTIQPSMMVKIISFQGFIDRLNFSLKVEGTVTLAVEDQASPWNQGTWQLTVSEGKGSLQLISDKLEASADFKGPIQAWTQVFFGAISINTQLFLEKIEGSNAEKAQFLTEAIPTSKLGLYDYF